MFNNFPLEIGGQMHKYKCADKEEGGSKLY